MDGGQPRTIRQPPRAISKNWKREERNPSKELKKLKEPGQQTVGTAKRKQWGQGKEIPSQKKGGSETGPQPSNPSLNKRQRKKLRRKTTEGEGATRGQGDRMQQQRPHGSSTHRSSRRGQKTATKEPVPQEQVKDKQTQQKEDQPRRAAETAQTSQLTCAPDTTGQKHTHPEARETKKRTEHSTHRGWEPQEGMTEQQTSPKAWGAVRHHHTAIPRAVPTSMGEPRHKAHNPAIICKPAGAGEALRT